MSERRRRIVCLSSQRWDEGMWTNKQHIMSRLGKKHDVYYVDFDQRPVGRVLGQALSGEVPRRPLRGLFARPREQMRDEVTLLDFYASSAVEQLGHGNPLRVFGQFDLRVRLLGRFLQERGIRDAIVWVYHPGYGATVARLPHSLLVYDCVDEYTAFPEFAKSKSWIAERERALCQRADLVFTTAPSLYESKRRLNPEHTHLVHNVGDAEHFNRALEPDLPVPEDVANLPHPVIGFVGAVSDYKLDADWVLHLAQARPNYSIVLVGPTGIGDPSTDVSRLLQAPNVHLLGQRAYGSLPGYLKGFDVAVIPYRINDYTRGVFPIKFFEFLASGRPVVISNLPALKSYYDQVLVATNADEFVARCDAALGDSEAHKTARVELAAKHSWPERIRQLMEHVEERLAELGRG
jgi:glycosyltransferase involved in cell wall biosynthesis